MEIPSIIRSAALSKKFRKSIWKRMTGNGISRLKVMTWRMRIFRGMQKADGEG